MPNSISIYAASYGSEQPGSKGQSKLKCSLRNEKSVGITTVIRIIFALLYGVAFFSSLISLICSIASHWKDKRVYPDKICICIALFSVASASIAVTVVAYAVHMVLAENVPQSLLSTEVGTRLLAITWSACICLALGLIIQCKDLHVLGSRIYRLGKRP